MSDAGKTTCILGTVFGFTMAAIGLLFLIINWSSPADSLQDLWKKDVNDPAEIQRLEKIYSQEEWVADGVVLAGVTVSALIGFGCARRLRNSLRSPSAS